MSSNQPTVTKTQPVHFENRDLVFETGGVKFVLHVQADMTTSNTPNPPPPNPVTPVPPPEPPGPTPGPIEGGVGLDGVKQMFPEQTGAKAKPFYINLDNPDADNKLFATTYGSKVYKFEKAPMTEGKIKFVRNMGAPQSYASGAPPGKSCRFHISAGKTMGDVGSHSWKDKPTPQYVTKTDTCFYSHEMTAIARVGKALGTHQSFAFKLQTRPDKPDDTLRSTIEFCMPNDQKNDPYINYNYAHAGYSKVTGLKQYNVPGKITVGQWIGVKCVFIIADDRKSSWMGLYVNTNPIDANGNPDNAGWKLKSEYTATGIKEYNNVPPVWGGDSYLRVDGYDHVDLYRFSQVEIQKGPLKQQQGLAPAPEIQFSIAQPPNENPADFNSIPEHVPQQDPSNPQAPPVTQVTNKQ